MEKNYPCSLSTLVKIDPTFTINKYLRGGDLILIKDHIACQGSELEESLDNRWGRGKKQFFFMGSPHSVCIKGKMR